MTPIQRVTYRGQLIGHVEFFARGVLSYWKGSIITPDGPQELDGTFGQDWEASEAVVNAFEESLQ